MNEAKQQKIAELLEINSTRKIDCTNFAIYLLQRQAMDAGKWLEL